jgi:hypothetical protein
MAWPREIVVSVAELRAAPAGRRRETEGASAAETEGRLMAAIRKKANFTAAPGTTEAIAAPGMQPFKKYAVQLKRNGGALTSWTLLLEGSLDGTNVTTLITHNSGHGSTQWTVDKPSLFYRVNLRQGESQRVVFGDGDERWHHRARD